MKERVPLKIYLLFICLLIINSVIIFTIVNFKIVFIVIIIFAYGIQGILSFILYTSRICKKYYIRDITMTIFLVISSAVILCYFVYILKIYNFVFIDLKQIPLIPALIMFTTISGSIFMFLFQQIRILTRLIKYNG